jgi:hypothetical protein
MRGLRQVVTLQFLKQQNSREVGWTRLLFWVTLPVIMALGMIK